MCKKSLIEGQRSCLAQRPFEAEWVASYLQRTSIATRTVTVKGSRWTRRLISYFAHPCSLGRYQTPQGRNSRSLLLR